jgi:hypothetical protein
MVKTASGQAGKIPFTYKVADNCIAQLRAARCKGQSKEFCKIEIFASLKGKIELYVCYD